MSHKLENKTEKQQGEDQLNFTLWKICYLATSQGQVGHMVAKQEQTKTLKFQYEDTNGEMVDTQEGSRGRL